MMRLTLNWGIFLTRMLSSFSLPSASKMSCWWPTSKVGHCWTRPMVLLLGPFGLPPVGPPVVTSETGLRVDPLPTIMGPAECCC